LTDDERRTLLGWAESADAALAVKAKIVLLAADGLSLSETSRRLGCGARATSYWRRRFLEAGSEGLWGGPSLMARKRRRIGAVKLDGGQRGVLERWADGGGDRPGLDIKAKAILLVADGATLKEAARRTGVCPVTVASWRKRLLAGGLESFSSDRTAPIAVDRAQRGVLERWARGGGDRSGLDRKAKVILSGADGVRQIETARRTGVSPGTVSLWRKRFLAGGLESLSSKQSAPIAVDGSQRKVLERWAQGGGDRPWLDIKATVILLGADGVSLSETARRAGVAPGTVASWRRSFRAGGLESLIPNRIAPFTVDGAQRMVLERLAGGGDAKLAVRAKAILMAADGVTAAETSRRTGVSPFTVAAWRRLFLAHRLEAGFGRSSNKRGAVRLGAAQRWELERWAEGGDAALAVKAKLILLAADGLSIAEASRRLGCDAEAAYYWRKRVLKGGPQALVRRQPFTRRSSARRIDVTGEQRRELQRLAADGGTRLAAAAKALISLADGCGVREAARLAGISPVAVSKSMRRFLEAGPEGLLGDPSLRRRMLPRTRPVKLDAAQRSVLERWAEGGGGGQAAKMSLRARIILMAADGVSVEESVRRAGTNSPTVVKWRRRFKEGGPQALLDLHPKRLEKRKVEDGHLALLASWAQGDGAGPRLAARAKAVLFLVDGRGSPMDVQSSGLCHGTARRWLRRFFTFGPKGLLSLRESKKGHPPNQVVPIAVDGLQRMVLEGWAQGGGGQPGLDRKAKALLLVADGATFKEAARRTGARPETVASWRKRFLSGGLESLPQSLPRPRGNLRGGDRPPLEPRRAGFVLAGGDRLELETWVQGGGATPAMAEMADRAKIILLGADGMDLDETARQAGVGLGVASFWWRRFSNLGLDGLRGTRARGPRFEAEVAALLSQPPPGHPRRWTALAMARVLGVGRSKARAVMVKLGALSGNLPAASPDPGKLARQVAILTASRPPEPFRRWTIGAVSRALDVSYHQARQGLVDAGYPPRRRGPGASPPDGGGGD
jgi:transposase-like protein